MNAAALEARRVHGRARVRELVRQDLRALLMELRAHYRELGEEAIRELLLQVAKEMCGVHRQSCE